MKFLSLIALVAIVAIGFAGAAVASEETTLTGRIMCAKCTLKNADAASCQDVLVVKGSGDQTVQYYIVKNDVATTFGHVCTGEKAAVVTGSVEEKDGKTWVTPTKMEEK